MSVNLKANAREVQTICKNTRVKQALNKLAAAKNSGDRDEQWGQVKRQFTTNCDMAQRIVLTPNPQPSLLEKIDLEYTKGIADRVLTNNSSNELQKLEQERAKLVAGRNSIEDPSSLEASSPVGVNANNPSGGRRRRSNKTNRKNRNRKTRKNRRNRN